MINAKPRKSLIQLFSAVAFVICWSTFALAGDCPRVTVDENGNGTIDFTGCGLGPFTELTTGVLVPDPGPGGLSSVLTYNLLGPPNLVAGDVLLTDAGVLLDVVRFNPAGTGGDPNYPASLLFYSDNVPTFDDLADTSGPPSAFYANTFSLPEGTLYTPLAGQPGFISGFIDHTTVPISVTYALNSDIDVPEPATLTLLGSGLAGLTAIIRKRRNMA